MKKYMNYFLTPAFALPENTPFKRVGIIPYFREPELHFFLMLDSKYQELTDCGGLPHTGETWIETAIRETEEESRNKFKFSYEYILNSGHVVWREDLRIAIIFIDVSMNISNKLMASNICYSYRVDYLNGIESKDKRHNLENSDMFFYSLQEMESLVKNDKKIFRIVRLLLLKFIRQKMVDQLLH